MSNEKKLWKYDELYTKLAKIRARQNDVVICYLKTDNQGNILPDVKQVQDSIDGIGLTLEKMGINAAVIAIPDKIAVNDVKNAKDTIRDLQNVIEYVKLATEKAGDSKNKKSGKPATINVEDLMKKMSFKGEEETQV